MAPDDRDRNLDKALARHFRSSVPEAASVAQPIAAFAAAPGAAIPTLSACPDSEILAAYHDGSLFPEELALWKAHVLACSDCQVVLEHLATPLDGSVTLNTAAADLVPAQLAPHAAALPVASRATSSTANRTSNPAPVAPLPSAPASISSIRRRKTYFRWLVPTGAVAAGLLTWMVIHESGIPKLRQDADALRVQTTESRPATAPVSPPVTSAPPAAGVELKRLSPEPSDNERQLSANADQLKQDLAKEEQKEKDQSLSAGHVAASAGASREQARADEQQLRDRFESAAPLARRSVPKPSNGPRISQQQQQQAQLSADAVGGAVALDKKAAPPSAVLVAPPEEPSFIEPGSVNPPPPQPKVQAAPAPPPPAPSSSVSGAPAAAPAKSANANAKARASADAAGALTQTITVESAATSSNMLRTASAFARGPQTFNDPAHKSLWRVGPAGSIEFSADNGASWTPQSSGLSADFFTGSAPAAKVCWIVGADGAILRTTDAGQHWVKLSAPVAADILGIHATDAFHATIWFVPDSKSTALQTFKTSDGALTWSLVSQ